MLSRRVSQMKKENEFAKYKWSNLSMIVLGYNLNAVGNKTKEKSIRKRDLLRVEAIAAKFAKAKHC